MKKTIFPLFIFIPIIFHCHLGAAQPTTICGTDTVILHVSNYQYGTIQWEESLDSLNWVAIEGARDTVYSFYPIEAKYYRAVVSFTDCPQVLSLVTHIQLPPVANAGPDRQTSFPMINLMANTSPGASGIWSIISGNGASLTDPNSPSSTFSGPDSAYTLVWTLSNTCGTSSDTLLIEFTNIDFYDEIVIVDSTDQMLSDSIQQSQGIYIVKFSSPVSIKPDTTILLGLVNNGFLRKIDSCIFLSDTCILFTSQGTLEDITKEGSIDIGAVFSLDTTVSKNSYIQRLNYLPTRQELLTDPKFKTGFFYYQTTDATDYMAEGINFGKNERKGGGSDIDIYFNSVLYSSGNDKVTLNGYYKFTPNFVADFDYSWFTVKSCNIGLYNANITRDYNLTFKTSSAINLVNQNITLLSIAKNTVLIIAGVPVWIKTKLSFDININSSISANLNLTTGYTHSSDYTAAIVYQNGSFSYPFSRTSEITTNYSASLTGDINNSITIGPVLEFDAYSVLGPYFSASLNLDANICTSPPYWQSNVNVDGEIKVGAKAEVLGKTIFDINHPWSQGFYHLQIPSTIEEVSGNNQLFTLGVPLSNAIKVKAKSNTGFPVPGVPITFSPLNGGTVQNTIVFTDQQGEAETIWTPGAATSSSLQASAKNCQQNHISSSPLTFTANQNLVAPNCANSSLSVTIKANSTNIYPQGNLGVKPYLYSTNGINYSSIPPLISPVQGQTYYFYIKDNVGCIASASYTAQPFSCVNSGLSVTAQVSGNLVQAFGHNGLPPYEFSLNSATGNFSSSSLFQNIPLGTHVIYIKDQNSCIKSTTISITSNNPPIAAAFYASTTSTSVGVPVQFQNLSSGGTTWLWDFGDATTSIQMNPTHTYGTPGTYTVKLTATNTYGSHMATKNNYITVVPILPGIPCPGMPTMTDYNGNIYNTVQIGTQCWMKENLKARNYLNGTAIPNITDNSTWASLSTGARCWYNNDSATYAATYGALYNWYAVDNTNGLCPTGWHVPTDLEWQTLEMYLGMSQSAANSIGFRGTDEGGKMKEAGLAHWNSPNTGATNSSGFTALPGGDRSSGSGSFNYIGKYGNCWSSAAATTASAWTRGLYYNFSNVDRYDYGKRNGFSVRCVRDY